MTDNPAPPAQVPPQFPSLFWYEGYCSTVAALRHNMNGVLLVSDQWPAILLHIKEALPALAGPNYADFHTGLAQLAESLALAAKMPLSPETRALCIQVFGNDLPRVMILTRHLQKVELYPYRDCTAPKPLSRSRSHHAPVTRNISEYERKLDLEQALATSVNLHMKELTQKVLADMQQWLASTGATGSAPAILQDHPQFLFAKAGSAWKVILDGAPEFHIPDGKGAKYLDWLFHHPNEGISAFDLEQLITPEKAAARNKDAFAKDVDPTAVRAYLTDLTVLRGQQDEAREQGDTVECTRLELQMAALLEQVRQCDLPKDAGERARNNVRKAIDVVKQNLVDTDKHQKAFRIHIHNFVKTGYRCEYVQSEGNIWQ